MKKVRNQIEGCHSRIFFSWKVPLWISDPSNVLALFHILMVRIDFVIAYQKAAMIAQQLGCSKPLEMVVMDLTRDQFRRLSDIQFTDEDSYKQGTSSSSSLTSDEMRS